VPEFSTKPTREVRHVPFGRVGQHVGLMGRPPNKRRQPNELWEVATPTPAQFGWDWDFRAGTGGQPRLTFLLRGRQDVIAY